jgi:putative ATPase
VPLHLRNAVTGLGRAMGYGTGYRYAHDHEGGVVAQEHLPESLSGHRYYDPSDHGAEREVAHRLAANREMLARRGDRS